MARSIKGIIKTVGSLCVVLLTAQQCIAMQGEPERYLSVPGLIDLRSSFSDGAHTIDELVRMARSRGFKVLFINDHDRIALAFGIPPFRNILRFKKEYPSIMTQGPDKYLEEINRVSSRYPDMIIIPGCETSPYYYWTGSWFKKDLTVHEYDRRIIITNLNHPEDYNLIPHLHNRLSLKYIKALIPGMVIFIIPLIIGFILVKWKGYTRLIGLFLILFSALSLADYNPFRSSLFSQYRGDQGIAPYQELINYVIKRGGLSFWNYPEQKSGTRKHGPIYTNTPPYPQVLKESVNYTGFAAIYGDNISVTDPGREWDRVLKEYCRGKRERAPWGISTADFHEEGRLSQKLGAFPTTFLVKELSKEGVLEAVRNGRMYSSRGDGLKWPNLDFFNIYGNDGRVVYMGETLATRKYPLIKFKVSMNKGKSKRLTIHLIRGGELLRTFKGKTPLEIEYMDKELPAGEKTYYRLMDNRKHLTSNPIFVTHIPPSTGD